MSSKSNMMSFEQRAYAYLERIKNSFNKSNIDAIENLARTLKEAWINGKNVFICGNGGSAANAIHMANDFHYGIGACGAGKKLPGLRVEALSANQGIVTCLANDIGYENIYAHQLEVKARKGDVLLILSGSGNSSNICKALTTSKKLGMKSFAIVGFDGGKTKNLADEVIYFRINDMQIAEDTQLVVGHMCMQWLNENKPDNLSEIGYN